MPQIKTAKTTAKKRFETSETETGTRLSYAPSSILSLDFSPS
jgi:hypothetical protein